MKRPVAVTLAVLLCSFIFTFSAGAVDAPHYDQTVGNVCGTCHTVQLTLGSTGYNNICLNCHRPGDPAAGHKPITLADAADPFGNHSTTGITRMYQTSHRWDGSDTNPAAGAQPPVQSQMTTNNLRSRTNGQLACVRCHNQHSNANGSFLRMANDQDQLCLDCHRSRNVQSHTRGSHPVGVPFNGTKAGFKAIPVNSANPTADLNNYLKSGTVSCSTCHGVHYTDSRSSTADGSSHFANLSSGDGYILRTDRRGTSAGAGFDSSMNICTTCHAGKTSHNMKGQDIQCDDCHGAHVEYDPNDPTGSKGTNIHLIRRAVDKRTTGSGQIFFRYTASQREYKNAGNTGVCQGCHVVPAPGGIYPSEHASIDPNVCNTCHYHNSSNGSFSGACSACHGYPPTTATLGGPTGLAIPATGATLASPGAHITHAKTHFMACNTCHTGYAGKAMPSNSIDIGFAINNNNINGFLGTVVGGIFNGSNTLSAPYSWSRTPGTTGTSTTANISCSVYCHGSTLTGGTNTIPVWTNTNQATCGSCHGITAATAPTTGSHTLHAGNGVGGLAISCVSCHGVHGNNDHVNGSVEWDLRSLSGSGMYRGAASGTTGATAPSISFGACSTVVCHGSGVVPWGGTLWSTTDQCGKCHSSTAAGAVTQAVPFYNTAYPTKSTANTDAKTGAHTNHMTSQTLGISASTACTDCHGTVTLTGATHMNGSTTFVWSSLATKTGVLVPTYNSGTGQCTATYCHGNSMPGGDTTGSNKSPIWKNPNYLPAAISSAACGTCHGFPPSAASGHPVVTIPAGFPATATIGTTCSCHANINSAGNSYANMFVNPALHINGILETPSSGHSFPYGGSLHLSAAGTTPWSSCTVCHTNAAGGTYPVASGTAPNCTGCHLQTLRVPSGTSSCWDCHGVSATNGLPNGTVFPNVAGSHAVHAAITGTVCDTCHAGGGTTTVTHGSSNRVPAAAATVKVAFTSQGASPLWTFATNTCSATNCHGQGAPTWGATSAAPVNGFPYSAAQCDKCHSGTAAAPFYSTAIPKVTANTDAKVGAHSSHLTAPDGLTNAFACVDCHGAVTLTAPTHMNGTTNFTWSTLATKGGTLTPTFTAATRVCSNVYCHGASMPGGDTTGTNRAPTWNSTTYLPATIGVGGTACKTCHGLPPLPASGHPTLATAVPASFGDGTTAIGTSCNCHPNINTSGTTYANIFGNKALHINGAIEASGGDCTICHNAQQGTGTRQVIGADTTLTSHHMQAATINQATCSVCHEQSTFGHQVAGDVAVGMFNQDTGAALTYDGTTTTAANLENSCNSCHDSNGAARLVANALKPFADSGDNTAPVNIGWTTGAQAHSANMACFNCHGNSAGVAGNTLTPKYNGHGSATAKMLQYPYIAASEQTFCYNCHGTTPAGGAVNAIQPLFTKTRKHSVESCNNCHNQHQAKPGTHTVGASTASGVLNGVGGATLTTAPAFWTAPAAGNFTAKTIVSGTDLEATLCFKCHTAYTAGYTTASPSGAFAMTDIAKEFNPNNVGNFAGTWASNETAGGFHPVLATAGSNLGAVNLANLVTTNFAWSTTARNRMTCSDCHGSATTTDPLGPHGSAANFILRGPNTTWSSAVTLGSTIPAGTFCLNCHANSFTNSRFTGHSRGDHFIACFNCHAAVPHGGPRPGMLVAGAGAAAAVGGTIAGWDTTSPYWQGGTTDKLYLKTYPATNTTNWAQSNCGCNGTGH